VAKKPADIWGVPIPSASDVVGYLNNAVNQGRVASGDKDAILPGDKGVRNLGVGISMTNDYLNPYANTTKQLLGMAAGNEGAQAKFAKSLAKDVAITAAGAGAGLAIGKGLNKGAQMVGAAIEEGKIVNPSAMFENFAKGNKIIVHGSTQTGMSELLPKSGSIAMPKDEVLFGWNPRAKNSGDWIDRNALNYTNPKDPAKIGRGRLTGEKPGSVYIASTPKKNTGPVTTTEKLKNQQRMVVSKSPGKVITEIQAPSTRIFETYIPGSSNDYINFRDKLARELRKAGVLPTKFKIPKPYKGPVAQDF
jgi:hypothetical protein